MSSKTFISSALALAAIFTPAFAQAALRPMLWDFQGVDTMKYSRDRARQFLDDSRADQIIEAQILQVAILGATHVAIATPYDEEFIPVLQWWVNTARRYGLNVWFRGNWSGWEGWFDYPSITRAQHLAKSEAFVIAHPELFADGDYFSACPECENGGPGDPRMNGDVAGHRQFLIDEHTALQRSFKKIKKSVDTRLNSMNGDVARLIMDKSTTTQLGGIVTIDHYVKTPEKLAADIRDLALQSGGKIVLGEWGAPIPDIHGPFTPTQQADWVRRALALLVQEPSLSGMSYWVSVGGSTALYNDDGSKRPVVDELMQYWHPALARGRVIDQRSRGVRNARVQWGSRSVTTDNQGNFAIAYPVGHTIPVTVSAANHASSSFQTGVDAPIEVTLQRLQYSWYERVGQWLGARLGWFW
jgi:hypothetical protein